MKDNDNAAEFETSVDDVFGRIAGRYDLLCDLFSIGIHRIWKRKVARQIASEEWEVLLDTATGTGDIITRLLDTEHSIRDRTIIASDISAKMLAMAEERLGASANEVVDLQILDAEDLCSIESNSVDCYSMSLGLKICNRNKALKEALRVLKPGGQIVLLEASNIFLPWLHKLYLLYMNICMPFIGWIATGGDSSAYKYLLQGIKDFPSAEELKEEMEVLGFANVRFRRFSLGIVAIHTANA